MVTSIVESGRGGRWSEGRREVGGKGRQALSNCTLTSNCDIFEEESLSHPTTNHTGRGGGGGERGGVVCER